VRPVCGSTTAQPAEQQQHQQEQQQQDAKKGELLKGD
jgi:hypothetical protein